MHNSIRVTGSSLSNPEALFRQLDIGKGAHVVDVGFGSSGELALLAAFVGETGLVYGVEPTRRKAKEAELALYPQNVHVLPGEAARLPLSENSVDLALYKGTLHEVRNIKAALLEAKRVCRDKGIVAIVDFSSFPEGWLKRSNLNWRVRHPWNILGRPPDRHPGFGREVISGLLEKAGLNLDYYDGHALLGRYYGHPVQMFLSTSIVRKLQPV